MDLALNQDFDLYIVDGDFAINYDDAAQRCALILMTYPGNWKQWPRTGIGKARFINAPINGELRRDIAMQLTADNLQGEAIFTVEAIKMLVNAV